jgi:hypothetical protein
MSGLSINVTDKIGVFSDIDFVARLTDTEDHFTERKSKSDKGGWLRTTVAFANSAPIGYPALLFVGVTDQGVITDNGKIEDLMKSYSDTISANSYPPIYTMPRVFTHNGKSCIAVTIPGSAGRPHFSGMSYIRDGTQTKPASEEQFAALIAQRSSKARMILEWKGKTVTHQNLQNRGTHLSSSSGGYPVVADCNEFFVTLRFGSGTPSEAFSYRSIPLTWIELSFDDVHKRLKIISEE